MTKSKKQYYKVARTDGFDFRTGNTINYRENIGKIVTNPKKTKSKELCSSDVLHASESFFDALGYGEIPCSIFLVEGNPVSEQSDKAGFKKLKIIEEITTNNWQSAYHKFVILMSEDLKNNFDTKKEKKVTYAINKTIKVFTDAQKTGKIDGSAAWSAVRLAWSAVRLAWSAAGSARSAAWSAAWSAESAVRSVESARSARSSGSAVRSAAESAAWSAESAVRSAKKVELSEKFIELLRNEE